METAPASREASSAPRPAAFDTVQSWVEQYLTAWRSNDAADISALFSPAAEYHESPYETHWTGRTAIVRGWRGRWAWQQGGWTFEWRVTSPEHSVDSAPAGSTVTIEGVGHYAELGDFHNTWTVQFDATGRCRRFDMVNEEIA